MTATGYAVVDLETTDKIPTRARIVEIAVVHVSPTGEITGKWETLVHPERDLGPTHIHGLLGAHMRNAPRFAQIADELAELLEGRVFVAHNARYDARVLAREWRLAKLIDDATFPASHLCTMQLASRLMPGIGRKLSECCASLDIELVDAHSACADAEATAKLLAAFIGDHAERPDWATAIPQPLERGLLRRVGTRGATVTRVQAIQAITESATSVPLSPLPASAEPSIARATEDEPGADDELLGESERDYLALLDRFLEDSILTLQEAEDLREAAVEYGIDSVRSEELHRHYFDGVVESVWRDGVLAAAEKKQLRTFGEILGIPAAAVTEACKPRAAAAPVKVDDNFTLEPGMHVVITGELSCPRAEWEERLREAGLVPESAITKKRTDVLIAADLDSLSGKAEKARKFGKPIRDEAWLIAALAPLALA